MWILLRTLQGGVTDDHTLINMTMPRHPGARSGGMAEGFACGGEPLYEARKDRCEGTR
jgi:hypothetical protein